MSGNSYVIEAVARTNTGSNEESSEVKLKYIIQRPTYFAAYTALLDAAKRMKLKLVRHTITLAGDNAAPTEPNLDTASADSLVGVADPPEPHWYADSSCFESVQEIPEINVESEWGATNHASHAS